MPKPYWNVFRTDNDKPWQKVGVAFLNRDGSYNFRLRTNLSAEDKLQMRQAPLKEKVKDQSKERSKQQGAEAGLG